jgi:hypothetical protein
MRRGNLRGLEFELVYLGLLTRAGLKPLSRWERAADGEADDWLAGLGLCAARVQRSVRSGRCVEELVFSRSPRCVEAYRDRYDGAPVDRTAATVRFEGRLFGYPSCCVESFAAHGYVRNGLRRADQKILFHWACPTCRVTPVLLPLYRDIHRQCRDAMRRGFLETPEKPTNPRIAWQQAAAIGLLMGSLACASSDDDPHWRPLDPGEDPDGDYLATWEEVILGSLPDVTDEDGNALPDGVDLACEIAELLDGLPTVPTPGSPYRIDHPAFGLETCASCGEQVNMGFIEVVGSPQGSPVYVPYIAHHAMAHGSFSYEGDVHAGRVNVPLLHATLHPDDRRHFIPEPPGTDGDNDGLRNWEEPAFGLQEDDPDTDGDGVRDGLDLSREMLGALEALPKAPRPDGPYVVEHPMDGIETCPRCGAEVVMDIWEVVNPLTGNTIAVSSMAKHFLEHGGFAWEGGQLMGGEGRVDPRHLQAVLTGEADGHWLPVTPDRDADLLADGEENDLGMDPGDPDEDDNDVLDGAQLAQAIAREINDLPTSVMPDRVCRHDVPLRGLEVCSICGDQVNMGHMTVCNPLADLYVLLPYIDLHFMEHGSFSYAGDVHGQGRPDVPLLEEALHSAGPSHLLEIGEDADGDGLTDEEEEYFGTDSGLTDSDDDGVPDGFDLAHRMWVEIEALPRTSSAGVCRIDHLMRGLVACKVCGDQVNMGWVEIVNPADGLRMTVSYLALHYMRHGSFALQDDHRVNPRYLDLVLHGVGTSHLVIVEPDADEDGLQDGEEPHFGTRHDEPDSDADGILDGIEVARSMARRIGMLPREEQRFRSYAIAHEAKGVVACPVCGEPINMGYLELVQPRTNVRMDVSFMALHFMELGSFAVAEHERIDPLRLEAILRPGVILCAGEGCIRLRWRGEPETHYRVQTGPGPRGPWTDGPEYVGDGSMIMYTDAVADGNGSGFYRLLAW